MFKNVAGQRWVVFAFNRTDGTPKTGDAAQITAKIAKDGAALTGTNDTNPTELEDGFYEFDLTQAETNADELLLSPESSTADIQVVGTPGLIYTVSENFKLQYDGTGITGDTFPATQAAVGNLTSGSAAINTVVASTEATTPVVVGTPTNTYTATVQQDGTYHSWVPDTGELEFAYNFNVGGNGVPVSVTWFGYCQSINDSVAVYARNWGGTSWEQIGTINGTSGATDVQETFDLTNAHVGTGSDLGAVRIRFVSTGGSIITTFATDRMLCSYAVVNQSVGYAEGAIWIDSAGTSGTENYVNGTADNPCPYADAKTISASLGITKFHIKAGNTLTLDANSDGYTFYGESWTLALGGQSIVGAHFTGATITGISSGAAEFVDCSLGAVTIGPSHFHFCGFGVSSGQFTAVGAGQYTWTDCYSLVPGSGSPTFVVTGLGSTSGFNNRRWSGGATWTLDSDCTLSHEVLAGGTTTVTTGGADVEIRGTTRAVTIVMSAAETIQFVGITGPITLSGTTTGTVNLYGTASGVTDTTVTATVNNLTGIVGDTAANDIADAYLDRAAAVDGLTPRQVQAITMAAVAGELSGANSTTITIKNHDGTDTRIVATVDADGNRSVISYTTTGIV